MQDDSIEGRKHDTVEFHNNNMLWSAAIASVSAVCDQQSYPPTFVFYTALKEAESFMKIISKDTKKTENSCYLEDNNNNCFALPFCSCLVHRARHNLAKEVSCWGLLGFWWLVLIAVFFSISLFQFIISYKCSESAFCAVRVSLIDYSNNFNLFLRKRRF